MEQLFELALSLFILGQAIGIMLAIIMAIAAVVMVLWRYFGPRPKRY